MKKIILVLLIILGVGIYQLNTTSFEALSFELTEDANEYEVFILDIEENVTIIVRLDEKPEAYNHSSLALFLPCGEEVNWDKSYQLTNQNLEYKTQISGVYRLKLITQPIVGHSGGTYPQIEVNWLLK